MRRCRHRRRQPSKEKDRSVDACIKDAVRSLYTSISHLQGIDMRKQTRSFDETRRDWSWSFHRENMRLDLEEGRRKHGIAREKDRLRRRKTGWRCRKDGQGRQRDRQRLQAGGRSRQGKEHAADAQRSLQEEKEKCWLLRQWHSYRVTA